MDVCGRYVCVYIYIYLYVYLNKYKSIYIYMYHDNHGKTIGNPQESHGKMVVFHGILWDLPEMVMKNSSRTEIMEH